MTIDEICFNSLSLYFLALSHICPRTSEVILNIFLVYNLIKIRSFGPLPYIATKGSNETLTEVKSGDFSIMHHAMLCRGVSCLLIG